VPRGSSGGVTRLFRGLSIAPRRVQRPDSTRTSPWATSSSSHLVSGFLGSIADSFGATIRPFPLPRL
jgi:hypothetical protein